MPSALPDGEPVPHDGSLPPHALTRGADSARPLGVYVHVPYCATRCGYCDFNTYTATELRGADGGVAASQENYAHSLAEEIRLARRVLGEDPRRVETVFVGGGTPTLLPAADLARMLAAVRDEFGLAEDAEITTEANPDSVDPGYLAELREAGFNRISFGMQSAREHVLRVLERTHTPGRPEECVAGGPQGGLRAREPGSDLRDAGRDGRGLARLPGRRAGRGPGPHLGVRAHRGGGHPALARVCGAGRCR